jgi:DNA-binding NarL/FixJ family response regulator
MGWKVPIRVLIADDSPNVRQAICRALKNDSEIQLIGEAVDFSSAVQLANELKPQVLVLDLHMPDQDEFDSMSFRSQLPNETRVIAISIWDDEETKKLAEQLGAHSFLEKMQLGDKLISAIKDTSRWISPLAQHLVRFIHDIWKRLILRDDQVDASFRNGLFVYGICIEREKKNWNLREHSSQDGCRF